MRGEWTEVPFLFDFAIKMYYFYFVKRRNDIMATSAKLYPILKDL
jgi:hypothetical protein